LSFLQGQARQGLATGSELQDTQGLNAHPPDFRVTVEGKEQGLALLVQDEVYRIAREVIRNAFHHPAASLIEVEIRYDNDQFRLRTLTPLLLTNRLAQFRTLNDWINALLCFNQRNGTARRKHV
jgi:hypothetical protein